MTTVYVPNVPSRMNPDTRAWEPVMNIWPAEKHGNIKVLFVQDEVMHGATYCRELIAARMLGVNPDDMLLHIGDPAIMAMVVRYHARHLQDAPLHLLKWDKRQRDYLKVTIK